MENSSESTDRQNIWLNNTVCYLFHNGFLSDIESRKIACTRDLIRRRAAIFQILETKTFEDGEKILEICRSNNHPLFNFKVLERVFSFLGTKDLRNCCLVSKKWKEAVALVVSRSKLQIVASSAAKRRQIINDEDFKIPLNILGSKIREIGALNLSYEIMEMQAHILGRLLSMESIKEEIMLEIFENMRDARTNEQKRLSGDMCGTDEIQNCNFTANALQNDAVLNRLFRFLSFKDIQSCRIVSRQWNSVAEPFLITRGRIRFTSSFRPNNFMDTIEFSSFPDLSFTAFDLSLRELSNSELADFFFKGGPNIQNVHLGEMNVKNGIYTCLSHTTQLKEFHLQGKSNYTEDVKLMLPWSKLRFVQNLKLRNVLVNADPDIRKRKISPLKIRLENVRFSLEGEYENQIYYNDYVDFSKARDIYITSLGERNQIFNWATDVIDADRITFVDVLFEGLPKPNSKVDFLKLYCGYPFTKRNGLQIKQLLFEDGLIDLAILPPTLQKLSLAQKWHTEISVSQPIYLPLLNFLSFRKGRDFHEIGYFRDCPKLEDMEILGLRTLDITWLPKSIKRMKLETYYGDFEFVGDEPEYIELDLLSLDCISNSFLAKDMDTVRPKVLVMIVKDTYDDALFVEFLRRNNRMEKIYVEFRGRCLRDNAFESSLLSALVDKKSDFYEFMDEFGRAITREEFKSVQTLVDIMTCMSPFWIY